MEMSWLNGLKKFVQEKPIIVLKLAEEKWGQLGESRHGVSEFTSAYPHALLRRARVPTLCLIQGKSDNCENWYLGLISSQSPVTTFESRIKVRKVVRIQPQTESNLISLMTEARYTNSLNERLRSSESLLVLSPKLSHHLVERLASIDANKGAMRAVAESLSAPRRFQGPAVLQEDAVRVALRAFGLSPDAQAKSLELVKGRETALVRVGIMEDAVIEHDARYVPGCELVQSDLTGRAVFERESERLEVFTANRRPLERVFGVDLIYQNASRQNIVMLQYKMLEPSGKNTTGTDWIYRPDQKLDEEIRRMQAFAANHLPEPHEYRLNPAVFYLKFVKRDGAISNGAIIMPVDHFESLRTDPTCRGPKKGLRVSYESLSGRYLRQSAFLDLVRSGYIGAHAETTAHMKVLVEAVLKNDRAVIAAIQQPTNTGLIDDDTDAHLGGDVSQQSQ
jgi:hypothetical protein